MWSRLFGNSNAPEAAGATELERQTSLPDSLAPRDRPHRDVGKHELDGVPDGVTHFVAKQAIQGLPLHLSPSTIEATCEELLGALASKNRASVVGAVRESIRRGYVAQLVQRHSVSSFVDDLESSITLLCDANYLSICDFAHQSLAFKLELLRLRSRVVTLNNQLRHRGARTLRQIENSSLRRVERRNLSRVVAVLTHLEGCVKLAALAQSHMDAVPSAPLGPIGGDTDYVAALRLVSEVRARLGQRQQQLSQRGEADAIPPAARPGAEDSPAFTSDGAAHALPATDAAPVADSAAFTAWNAARTRLGRELVRWANATEAAIIRIGEVALCGDGKARAGWIQFVVARAVRAGASAMRAEERRMWQRLERVDARSAATLGWGQLYRSVTEVSFIFVCTADVSCKSAH